MARGIGERNTYSTMQARIGRSKNSLIVLEEVRGDILKWTTSNFVKSIQLMIMY